MAEFVSLEIKELPELLVVGKALHVNMAEHMKHNSIPGFWDECFAQGIFEPLERQEAFVFDPSYVGWMADDQGSDNCFIYVVGMLMKPGTPVPEGYFSRAMPAQQVAVGLIRGSDTGDVCSDAHGMTQQAFKPLGYSDAHGTWCMELYNCPRFTTPDAEGKTTLDYYIPVEKGK